MGVNGNADVRGRPRIRGRKSTQSLQQSGVDEAWVSPVPPGGADSGCKTTEDPYVQASLKRSIVELYDTCHRLLSFKVKPCRGEGGGGTEVFDNIMVCNVGV